MLIIIPFGMFAQKKLDKINASSIIEEAMEFYENGEVENSISLLSKIHENDTLYYDVVLKKAYVLFNSKEYDTLLELCNTQEFFDNYNFSMQIYKGVALIRLKRDDDAVNHFLKMLELYPKSHLVNYNLGIAYKRMQNYDKAIDAFINTINCNPYYAPPHLELGNICYQEDLLSQAMFCYNTYLLLNPTSSNSLNVLSKLDEIVSSKNELEPLNIDVSSDDGSFEEIDLILKNYTALNKSYKVDNKIELSLVKQDHVLFELLKEHEGNGGFWDKTYVNFYNELFQSGYFNDFIYYIMSSTTNEKFIKIINKNKKKEDKFIQWAVSKWINIIGDPKNTGNQINYINSGELESVEQADINGILNGSRNYYTKNGRIRTKGYYLNDERDGHWEWYYSNGQKDEEVDYTNGALDGSFNSFYQNGHRKLSAIYKNNYYDGDLYRYNEHGVKTESSFYKNDSLNETTILYHELGKDFKKTEIPYKNSEINGTVVEYYSNGKEKFKLKFEDGDRVGKEEDFFNDGSVEKIYVYKNGSLNGEYIEYYYDGTIYMQGSFKDGYRNGTWKSYYKNGTSYTIANYNEKGELSGTYEEYDINGHIAFEYEYEEDKITAYKYYNLNDSITESEVKKDEGIYLKGTYTNGNNKVDGFLGNAGRKGNWKFYNIYGCLTSEEDYENSSLVKGIEYFSNGDVESVTNYNNGNLEGYYHKKSIDGDTIMQGYYENNLAEGFWNYYYQDGTISDRMYYFHNLKNGIQYDYAVNGKLNSTDFYEEGKILYSIYYDTLGNRCDTINYYINSEGTLLYPNGQIRLKYNYLNGKTHGIFEWYYINGQLSSKGEYFDNEPNGYWVYYDEQGNKTSEGNYFYGDKIGKWYKYSDTGIILSEANYKQGLIYGEYKTFNQDGSKKYEANYENGVENGKVYFYSEKGDLQLVRFYNYGELLGYTYLDNKNELLPMIELKKGTGEIKSFYPNGRKSRELSFVNGELQGEYKKYHLNGSLVSRETHKSGVQQGESLHYYDNGKIKQEVFYINDAMHGEFLEYYENGNIKSKLMYINGELSGKCSYFKEDGSLDKIIVYYNGRQHYAEYY